MSPEEILRHQFKEAYPSDVLDLIGDFFNIWNLVNTTLWVVATLTLLLPSAEKTKRLLFLLPVVTYGVYQVVDLSLTVMYLSSQSWYRAHNTMFLVFHLASYVHSRFQVGSERRKYNKAIATADVSEGPQSSSFKKVKDYCKSFKKKFETNMCSCFSFLKPKLNSRSKYDVEKSARGDMEETAFSEEHIYQNLPPEVPADPNKALPDLPSQNVHDNHAENIEHAIVEANAAGNNIEEIVNE